MSFTITKLQETTMSVTLKQRTYRTVAGKAVAAGTPEAAFLVGPAGAKVSDDQARALGLVDGKVPAAPVRMEARAPVAPAEPQGKADKDAPEDKADKDAPEDKGSVGPLNAFQRGRKPNGKRGE